MSNPIPPVWITYKYPIDPTEYAVDEQLDWLKELKIKTDGIEDEPATQRTPDAVNGVHCTRCNDWCPDAEKSPKFLCYTCRSRGW